MNLANLFSIYRIAVTPVIIYAIYQNSFSSSLFALSLLLLAFISDTIDGYLARKTDKVTKEGSFLDPFADKFLVVCLIFVFWLREVFSIYYLRIFVLRDIVFLITRMMSWHHLNKKKKLGKLAKKEKMVVLANRKSSGYHDGYRRKLLNKFCERRGAELIYLPETKDMYKGMG